MKKVLMLFTMLSVTTIVTAQSLFITNSTCTDINISLTANNSSCNAGTVDNTNTILVPGGNGSDVDIDFSGGPYSYTVNSGSGVPGTLWATGTGLNNPGWDFHAIIFMQVCGGSIGTCNNGIQDYFTNGTNTIVCPPWTYEFLVTSNCAGNSCDICPGPPTPTILTMDVYKVGADWHIDFF